MSRRCDGTAPRSGADSSAGPGPRRARRPACPPGGRSTHTTSPRRTERRPPPPARRDGSRSPPAGDRAASRARAGDRRGSRAARRAAARSPSSSPPSPRPRARAAGSRPAWSPRRDTPRATRRARSAPPGCCRAATARCRTSARGSSDRPDAPAAPSARPPRPPAAARRRADRARWNRWRDTGPARRGRGHTPARGHPRGAPWPPPPHRWQSRPDRTRSRDRTDALASSRWLHRRKFVAVQAHADLLQRLEDVGARALGRALETLADRLVVEVVDLAEREGQPLLQRQPGHHTVEQRARLPEHVLLLGARRVRLGAPLAGHDIRAPPARLGAEVIARQVGRDGEQPRANVGVRGEPLPGAVGPQERLLGQVIRLAGAKRQPPQVSIDLRMVRGHDIVEEAQAHTLNRTPDRPQCERGTSAARRSSNAPAIEARPGFAGVGRALGGCGGPFRGPPRSTGLQLQAVAVGVADVERRAVAKRAPALDDIAVEGHPAGAERYRDRLEVVAADG